MENFLDKETLEKMIFRKMPFGKYKGTFLPDLPVYYLEWFAREGFPQGTIGKELALIYEIKTNGLMPLLEPLRRKK